jgi:hypothetical protein
MKKSTLGFRLYGWSMLLLSIVAYASESHAYQYAGFPANRQATLRGTHEYSLGVDESVEVDHYYCALGATAHLTLDKSTHYPVLLEIFGGTYQESGRADVWQKLAYAIGDQAYDTSLPFGSIFGFHVTNQSHQPITVTVTTYC